jgi:uncharacterized membrane protein
MSSPGRVRISIARPLWALLLTIAAVVLVGLRATPVLTVPSGLLLVLVLPGYVWVHALFSGESQPLVRPALIVATSLGITMVVGLAANEMPDGITRTDWCIGFEAAVVLGVVVSLVRAVVGGVEPAEGEPVSRFERLGFPRTRIEVSRRGIGRVALAVAAALSLVVMLVAAGWASIKSESDWEARQHFTALSVSGVGTQRPTVEVTDHEGTAVSYTVTASLLGRQVLTENLRVQAGQTRRLPLFGIVAPLRPGRLLVTLDRPGTPSPYRQVWLRARDGLWG